MTEFEPMDVHREIHRSGVRTTNTPVPPLDEHWSNTDKLRWLASLVEYSTGLRVRINDGHSISGPGYDLKYPDYFGASIGDQYSRTTVSGDYHRMWKSLSDIETGAMAMRRHLGLAEHNPPIETPYPEDAA